MLLFEHYLRFHLTNTDKMESDMNKLIPPAGRSAEYAEGLGHGDERAYS